jgi:hypothetical protein
VNFGADQTLMLIALVPAVVGGFILANKNASEKTRRIGWILVIVAVFISLSLFF